MSVTHIRVRGYHLDVFQHVNNARYLEFLEEARWAYFDETGLTPLLMTTGHGMAVINIDIHYRRSAHMDDDLVISTRFVDVYPRKAVLSQVITFQNSGKVVADAKVVFVAFNQQTNKAITFSSAVREVLQRLVSQPSISPVTKPDQ